MSKMDQVPGKDMALLNKLQGKVEEKEQVLKDMGQGGWFMPWHDKSVFKKVTKDTIEDNEKPYSYLPAGETEFLPREDISEETLLEKSIVSIIPTAVKFNDKNTQKNESYLLEYIDIKTGDEGCLPICGNIPSQFAKKFAEVIPGDTEEDRKKIFSVDTQFPEKDYEKLACSIRYWWKRYNKKEELSFHTFTVEPLA